MENARLRHLVVALSIAIGAVSGPAVLGGSVHAAETAKVSAGTDRTFLEGIHLAGIMAPDEQAISTAHDVARMDSAGTGTDEISRVVRGFGVYDYHVDAFTAAAVAAYGPYSQDGAFLEGIHRAGIIAPDQQAIRTAHDVANMSSSDASPDDISRAIRNFGVYDYHVDAFTAAAVAAYAT
jgi:hypothetical protein